MAVQSVASRIVAMDSTKNNFPNVLSSPPVLREKELGMRGLLTVLQRRKRSRSHAERGNAEPGAVSPTC